ncbi:hypothetical protein H5185_21840, partial [Shewanella sp. SG44-6]|uniref:hypothetical protein n=1 Tax=Shewanella sp. SG44-6 TaxID=2760959 RepID=UPI001601900C
SEVNSAKPNTKTDVENGSKHVVSDHVNQSNISIEEDLVPEVSPTQISDQELDLFGAFFG